MNWDAFAVAAALLVGAGTIYFSARQITKQLKVVTFLEFTRRYEYLVDRLPHAVRLNPLEADLGRLDDPDRVATESAILSYFNLCSEEFYLHRERLVSKKIWWLWRRGLIQTLKSPAVKQVWQKARQQYYSEFRDEIDRFIDASPEA